MLCFYLCLTSPAISYNLHESFRFKNWERVRFLLSLISFLLIKPFPQWQSMAMISWSLLRIKKSSSNYAKSPVLFFFFLISIFQIVFICINCGRIIIWSLTVLDPLVQMIEKVMWNLPCFLKIFIIYTIYKY